MPPDDRHEELERQARKWLEKDAPVTSRRIAELLRRKPLDTGEVVGHAYELLLNHPSARARLNAVAFLAESRLPLPRALDGQLLRVLSDPDSHVRAAVRGLVEKHLCERDRRFAPFIREAMGDEDTGNRYYAVRLWLKLGRRVARSAVPDLQQLLHDRVADVRGQALVVLRWLGPDAAEAIPAVVKLAERAGPGQLRRGCWRAVLDMAPDHAVAARHLAAITDPDCREDLLEAVRSAGEPADPLLQALEAAWDGAAETLPSAGLPALTHAVGPAVKGTAAQPSPHPNGPESPNCLWWEGKVLEVPETPFNLLLMLWDKDCFPIEDLESEKLFNLDRNPSALKSALHDLSSIMASLDIPYRWGKKGSFVVKKPAKS